MQLEQVPGLHDFVGLSVATFPRLARTCYGRVMFDKANSIVYRSGTANGLDGWDVMQVVYLHEESGAEQIVGSVVIARHPDGTILRNIDLNKWEKITDEEDLKKRQKCFDDRDKAAAERASAARVG